MKTKLSSRRRHCVTRGAIFLIMAALMAGMVGCGPTAPSYSLTIAGTAGGSVTTPGEDTFTYDELTVVNVAAEAEEGYIFVNWTGDVGTIACVIAATTTVTMNTDYSIMANFEEWVWTFPNPNIEAIVGDIRERGYVFPSDVQRHNFFHTQP